MFSINVYKTFIDKITEENLLLFVPTNLNLNPVDTIVDRLLFQDHIFLSVRIEIVRFVVNLI